MKRCPTCNRTYADETLAYCLADGSLLSAPYDPEATEIISPPLVSPSRAVEPPTTEVLSPKPSPRQPTRQGVNPLYVYTLIALIAVVVGGGIVALLTSRSKDSVPSPSSNVTPEQAVARATNGGLDARKQEGQNANRLSSAPAKEMLQQNAGPGKDPEAAASESDTRRGSGSTPTAALSSNQNQGQGDSDVSDQGTYGIVIENAWVAYSPNKTFGVCFVSFSEEEKVVFVRFTISASRSTLPETRSTDFMLVADQNRRFDPACGSASFNPAAAEPKTITLAYKVPRNLRSATFRFHRTGYGEPLTFELTNLN